MNIWKLSLKTSTQNKKNVFEKCKENSIIGIGWHAAYSEKTPKSYKEAKKLIVAKYQKVPYQIKYFIEEMKKNDYVWIHQNGKYYLIRIADENIIYGKNIDPEFKDYDLGHARKVIWIEVPEKFVSGKIQRGTIAPRTIQRINLLKEELEYNEFLFKKLEKDPRWEPEINEERIIKYIEKTDKKIIFSIMTPDDVEDIIAAYLQKKGWILIKSTCYRSKPQFEFSMINIKGEIAQVQVKSGNISLKPKDFQIDSEKGKFVYLFSTNTDSDPYPGESFNNIITICQDNIINWIKKNLWVLTLPLKLRLLIFIEMKH